MIARSIKELEDVWLKLDKTKNFSDNIGGFGIGVNGLLSLLSAATEWLGGIEIFELWTLIIGGYLLFLAMRSRASPGTLVKVFIYLGIDMIVDLIPIPMVGGIMDAIYRGPLTAARAIQKDIERTHWIEGTSHEAKASGAYARHFEEMRAQKKRRVVYLHD
jgi:Domain of unknown function (DUF4112)